MPLLFSILIAHLATLTQFLPLARSVYTLVSSFVVLFQRKFIISQYRAYIFCCCYFFNSTITQNKITIVRCSNFHAKLQIQCQEFDLQAVCTKITRVKAAVRRKKEKNKSKRQEILQNVHRLKATRRTDRRSTRKMDNGTHWRSRGSDASSSSSSCAA